MLRCQGHREQQNHGLAVMVDELQLRLDELKRALQSPSEVRPID